MTKTKQGSHEGIPTNTPRSDEVVPKKEKLTGSHYDAASRLEGNAKPLKNSSDLLRDRIDQISSSYKKEED